MTEAEVRQRISGYELTCWQILENIQPWGQKRADYRSAVICWFIACCNYDGKGRMPQLKDYMKLFDFEPKEPKSDEEFLKKIQS